MGSAKKLTAFVLAVVLTAVQTVSTSTLAAENSAPINNTTISSESKAQNTETPFHVFDIYNAYRELVKPAPQPHDRLPNGKYLLGVDVSEFQEFVDWYTLKNSGQADFAILRAGYGREYYQRDKRFDENARNAQAAGMDFGIYWYSYAMDTEGAKKEAEVCMSMLDGYSFSYPVYFDIEEMSQRDRLSTAQFSAIVDTFCSTLEENGYTAGIYSFGSMLETKVYKSILQKYDIWVAEYNDRVKVFTGDYGIWQYTGSGNTAGISTIVDRNYCYRDYPSMIGVNPSTGTARPKVDKIKMNGTDLSAKPIAKNAGAGVKLSSEDGTINWARMKNSGIKFAMIKAADSGSNSSVPFMDKNYYTNMEEAQKAGLDYGVYWHSRSLTAEKMKSDAEWFASILDSADPSYPVFLDMTDDIYVTTDISGEKLSALVKAFCSVMEEEGFYVGVYGTEDMMASLAPELTANYDVWLTMDRGEVPATNFGGGMSSVKNITIPGTVGGVEVVYSTRNYPSIMKEAHLNGF